MTIPLDPAGLEAAAKLARSCTPTAVPPVSDEPKEK